MHVAVQTNLLVLVMASYILSYVVVVILRHYG